NAHARTSSVRERPQWRGATYGSAHEPVTPTKAASRGPFARTQGAVRGDAEESRVHSEQHSHHAAQAQIGESISADDHRRVGPGGRSRSRLSSASSRTWRALPPAADISWRLPPAGALHFSVEDKKLAAVWEYETNSLYSAAERATLDLARAAASVPNAVTDDIFAELRKHWTEEQIVEIVGVISLFGFLNRWNNTMATPLEDEPIAV